MIFVFELKSGETVPERERHRELVINNIVLVERKRSWRRRCMGIWPRVRGSGKFDLCRGRESLRYINDTSIYMYTLRTSFTRKPFKLLTRYVNKNRYSVIFSFQKSTISTYVSTRVVQFLCRSLALYLFMSVRESLWQPLKHTS